jgi:hypothetical protein
MMERDEDETVSGSHLLLQTVSMGSYLQTTESL